MPTQPDANVSSDALTPLVMLMRTARVFPDREAVVHGKLRWSYAQLALETGRMAGALRRAGVVAGDRVAILAPNTPAHLLAHFAMPLLGAPLVSINTRLAPAEIAYILDHCGAKILLVDPELAPPLDAILPARRALRTVVEIPDEFAPARPGKLAWDEFARDAPVLPISNTVSDEESVISINYTSGTTGQPKGVMYTHRGAYLNALSQIGVLGLDRRSTLIWTVPMFHCNGWCMAWAFTGAAGKHVCLRKVDPPEIFRLIDDEGITHLNGAPTVLLMLASDPAAQGRRFDPPLHTCTGGAPPSPTLLEQMEKLGVRITHLYGLTETYGPHVVCEMQDGWERLETGARAKLMSRQGVPYPHAIYLRVVDGEMNDVPADAATMGEVVMRGNNVMRGYYDDPEATAKAFAGGWFHSGDVGVVHPDGYIELRDRSKDIIISGGENISTIEVENIVVKHPAVLECAVVSMPHEKWGEVPKAFVALRPGANATAEEIIAFTREHLAAFKCPKAIEFGELPKTGTGKIQKFKLREKEWQGKGRVIMGVEFKGN
ncbi:MAG: long-chain-fatty-acid--CoA ligase [Deltaproteobacteria bacterium]|nr:long-chain-fatty-acid--CoA ligase [Deltaproteobacteria bacterium]